MVARIGVEPQLTAVKEALMEMGHEVIDLRSEEDVDYCDCCIISGLDKNLMGISHTFLAGPVINAQGQDTNEIVQQVNERLT